MLNLILAVLVGWLILAVLTALATGAIIRVNEERDESRLAATQFDNWEHPLPQ